MKKLALLFLILPLPAFAESATARVAVPPPKETIAHIAKAESHCRANDIGPSDSHYTKCVNGYLQEQYGITLSRAADGSLRVAYHNGSVGPGFDSETFGNPPSSNEGTWPTPAR